MNLTSVSVENSKYHRAFIRPKDDEPVPSPPSPNRPHLPLEPFSQLNAQRSIIDRALQRLTNQGLCGQAYVKQYLGDLQRRNCRPSTIRNNFQSIALFLHFLKKRYTRPSAHYKRRPLLFNRRSSRGASVLCNSLFRAFQRRPGIRLCYLARRPRAFRRRDLGHHNHLFLSPLPQAPHSSLP